MTTAAIILGIVSLIGTIVGVSTNNRNNQFIEDTNEDNRQFQEETNLQNHQWALEAAQWEYEHNKPQRQYADLMAAGITPAAAAQKISGANVSYSPATAVAPQNQPKSTNMLNDSLQQVISDIGNFSNIAQAQASADKLVAETHVITETGVNKAIAEIDNILTNTELSYSQKNVADSQVDSINANTDLTNEKINTEKQNQQSIQLSNQEREIQLEFTRKTLEMSVKKTDAEIKQLSIQTAKLQEELEGVEFENAYQKWVNTYIQTYGVSPDQGWQDMLFKSIADGNAGPLLDSFSQSLRQIYDTVFNSETSDLTPYQRWQRNQKRKRQNYRNAKKNLKYLSNGGSGFWSLGDWYGYSSSW